MRHLRQVRVQHPVGHGFFHSSTIRSANRRFDYVVDCGGVESPLQRQIQAFRDGRVDRALDLLVVSHFHDDHVGGLEDLLSDLEVRAVAVPYLSPEEKLLCLAAMSQRKRDAKNEQLLLRPREWAQEKGAETVYFVYGDTSPPEDIAPLVSPNQQRRDPVPAIGVEDDWLLAPHAHNQQAPGAYALPHSIPLEVRSERDVQWVFNFFCYTNSKLRQEIQSSLESKKKWSAIRRVWEAVQRGDDGDILSNAKTRSQLRQWYEFLVGDKLNVTSLSLLSAPAMKPVCARYRASYENRDLERLSYWHSDAKRVGWLGTGDTMLRQADLAKAFLKRFEPIGLNCIASMSLPHHGSARNHSGAVLDRLDPMVTFVTCPLKVNDHHPAPEVERAVRARGGSLLKVTERDSSLLCEHVSLWIDG